MMTGTVVIWLWYPLCVTSAQMLVSYGMILGFIGDLNLSIPDPTDTLLLTVVALTLRPWHPASIPTPVPPACSWWDPFQFQLPSTGPTAGHRKHTPFPSVGEGAAVPMAASSRLAHGGSFATDCGFQKLSPAVTQVLNPTSPKFHGIRDKVSELLL